MYAARHCSNLPTGFRWPASPPRSECTVVALPSSVRVAIASKADTLRPAWEVPGSGAIRPDRTMCIQLATIAHGYRKPERLAYALAWIEWCVRPEGEAPSMHAHRISPEDARAIRQRVADAGLFDPRDFHNVPF
jgi:hypothetical protein